MKKFLSILAAVGLTATASTAVVSCGVIKKSVSLKNTDLAKDGTALTDAINSAHDFKKNNSKIANKIGKSILKAEDKAAKKAEGEGQAAPKKGKDGWTRLNTDYQGDAKGLEIVVAKYNSKADQAAKTAADQTLADANKELDKLKDALSKAKNADDKKAAQTAVDAQQKIVDAAKLKDEDNYNSYALGDVTQISSDLATDKGGVVEIKFISAINLINVLNNKTYNMKLDENNKSTKDMIIKKTAVKTTDSDTVTDDSIDNATHDKYDPDAAASKDTPSDISLNDVLDIERKDDTFTASWNKALMSAIVKETTAAGQGGKVLLDKIFTSGDHEVQLTVNIDDATPGQEIAADVIKKYAE